MEDEPGADRVEELLRHEQVLLPWTALLEIYYITEQERGRSEADRRYATVLQLPARILWQIDEPLLLTAAHLKAAHRLSLADALVAALAIREGVTLIHKDPEFEALDGVATEALPYRRSQD
jgi:ribonuclease VapC